MAQGVGCTVKGFGYIRDRIASVPENHSGLGKRARRIDAAHRRRSQRIDRPHGRKVSSALDPTIGLQTIPKLTCWLRGTRS